MNKKRILLIRDRDFFFHVYQLALFLANNGHEVEVLLTQDGEQEPLYRDLIEKVQQSQIKCHLIPPQARTFERKLVSLASRLRIISRLAVITPYKIRFARKAIA